MPSIRTRLVYDENDNFLGYEQLPDLTDEEWKVKLDASIKGKAEILLAIFTDPNFKPAPLFPNSERLEDLFGLCEIYEDGSCSLDRKE